MRDRGHGPRTLLVLALLVAAGLAVSPWSPRERGGGSREPVPGQAGAFKSTPAVRAARRAYAGAPPVIPHPRMGASCLSCHDGRGVFVPEYGFAPPSPHKETKGMGSARCEQCHAFQVEKGVFRANTFQGATSPPLPAPRMYRGAPPVIPHPVFMREACLSCHDGPGAREPIRTSHPERSRCLQCHARTDATGAVFARAPAGP